MRLISRLTTFLFPDLWSVQSISFLTAIDLIAILIVFIAGNLIILFELYFHYLKRLLVTSTPI
jgi:hypothetical protein